MRKTCGGGKGGGCKGGDVCGNLGKSACWGDKGGGKKEEGRKVG